MPTIISVDPGLPLTIAVLTTETGRLSIYENEQVATDRENDPQKIASIFRMLRATGADVHVVVERVAIWPGEDVKLGAAFVGSMHLVIGVCAAFLTPVHNPTPAVWKREAGVPGKAEASGRRQIVALAQERLPQARALFSRVRDHNRADAALLALWYAQTRGWKVNG